LLATWAAALRAVLPRYAPTAGMKEATAETIPMMFLALIAR
jgi:hypothetical protein